MFEFYNKIMEIKMSKPIVAAIFAFAIFYCLAGAGCLPSEIPAGNTSDQTASENLEGYGTGRYIPSTPDYEDYGDAYAWTSWDAATSPNYYRVAGPAVESYNFTYGEVAYGGKDELGRTTWAGGIITAQMRADAKARGRQDFTAECDDISGWGYNDKVVIPSTNGGKDYRGYMYNRSHLVADSLGGDAMSVNLITGTRCQNVGNNDNSGGMAYSEDMARDYLDSHPDGSIYYAATPVYEGDELVARSVYVDIKSDDGSIDEHIEVYNTAMGYDVNYATGEFSSR